MRWWPFVRKTGNGSASAAAQQEAERKLEAAKARTHEVSRAIDQFSAAVERAMRGTR